MTPLNNFPQEFQQLPIWCLWRYESRDGKQTKVPYQPNGWPASSTNRATWSTLEDCLAVVSNFDGLGIFADGTHTFIDLDDCIADGVIQPWALAVLARTNSYAERSPSGTGLHIFVLGTLGKPGRKVNGCEMYSQSRFFTVTDKHVSHTPLVVNAMPAEELEELRDDIAQDQLRPQRKAEPGKPAKSGLIVQKPMSAGERETKLERALSGDTSEYGNDRSSAVHGALQLLARRHAGDREAIQQEFEDSQLCEDWGEKWDRLADAEIDKAIERWEENGKPAWAQDDKPTAAWSFVRYSSIQAKPIAWIWKGYLAAGKITMVNGEPSHGKSLVSLDIGARISRGTAWPDGTANDIPPSSVLLLTEEEDDADTIKPRFLAAGGDPDKLISLSMGAEIFRIENHADRLRKMIEQSAPDTKLIILDPVSDYTAVDANKDTEVRPMLTRLANLARELGIAIVGINHLNKKTDLSALHRVAGARAWVSVARLNFLVGKTEDGLRHLASLKTNVSKDGDSIGYIINARAVSDGLTIIPEVPFIVWQGKGNVTAEQLTAAKPAQGGKDPAEDWLRQELKDGDWHITTHLLSKASELEFHEKKIQRVANKLKVERRKVGMPAQVEWRIPTAEAATDAHA